MISQSLLPDVRTISHPSRTHRISPHRQPGSRQPASGPSPLRCSMSPSIQAVIRCKSSAFILCALLLANARPNSYCLSPDATSGNPKALTITSPKATDQPALSVGYMGTGPTVTGYFVDMKVSFASYVVDSMPVGLATSLASDMSFGKSCIMGISYSPTRRWSNSFWDNVRGQLLSQVFTADLDASGNGKLNLGWVDGAYRDPVYSSLIVPAGDSELSNWMIRGEGSPSYQILVDTGAGAVAIPQAIVDAYFKDGSVKTSTNGDGNFAVDCKATLPDLTVKVAGGTVKVSGKSLIGGVSSGSQCRCLLVYQGTMPWASLGQPMFASNFVIFDHGGSRVGFVGK